MYIRPTAEEVAELKRQHALEKSILRSIETVVDYKINNPELTVQRDKVRRIKDKIIMAEAFDLYPIFSKKRCAFNASEYCEEKINYSFYHWLIYGNCCRECSKFINSSPTKYLLEDTPLSVVSPTRQKFLDELSTLDAQDIDILSEA